VAIYGFVMPKNPATWFQVRILGGPPSAEQRTENKEQRGSRFCSLFFVLCSFVSQESKIAFCGIDAANHWHRQVLFFFSSIKHYNKAGSKSY
jgi:hypothetical protein